MGNLINNNQLQMRSQSSKQTEERAAEWDKELRWPTEANKFRFLSFAPRTDTSGLGPFDSERIVLPDEEGKSRVINPYADGDDKNTEDPTGAKSNTVEGCARRQRRPKQKKEPYSRAECDERTVLHRSLASNDLLEDPDMMHDIPKGEMKTHARVLGLKSFMEHVDEYGGHVGSVCESDGYLRPLPRTCTNDRVDGRDPKKGGLDASNPLEQSGITLPPWLAGVSFTPDELKWDDVADMSDEDERKSK